MVLSRSFGAITSADDVKTRYHTPKLTAAEEEAADQVAHRSPNAEPGAMDLSIPKMLSPVVVGMM